MGVFWSLNEVNEISKKQKDDWWNALKSCTTEIIIIDNKGNFMRTKGLEDAIVKLKKGKKVTRVSWGKENYLKADLETEMISMYIDGTEAMKGWRPKSQDMFAVDWIEL